MESRTRVAPLPETTDEEPPFKPLTADEARRLREQIPVVSPWWVVAGQAVVGLVVALAAWAVTGRQNVGWSAGYGALAVVIPAAIFARGLTGRFASLEEAADAMWAISRSFGPHSRDEWLALSRHMVRPLADGGCPLVAGAK